MLKILSVGFCFSYDYCICFRKYKKSYWYTGKAINILNRLKNITRAKTGLQKVIYPGKLYTEQHANGHKQGSEKIFKNKCRDSPPQRITKRKG